MKVHQSEGAAIGSDLTGELSRVVMALWDREFLNRLHGLGQEPMVYKRYVDDIVLIIQSLAGKKYNRQTNSLEHDPTNTLPHDQTTMSILSSIANQIEDNLQTTFDCPSIHADLRMPVLDLKVWINKQTGHVSHVFYKKPVSHPLTIMQRSAISSSIKRSTLFQEGLRRLNNCSIDIDKNEVNMIMSEYMNCLRMSGYKEAYRRSLLRGIMIRHQQVQNKINNGLWSRYRSRQQIVTSKQAKSGKTSANWFVRGEIRSTVTGPSQLEAS